VPGCRSLNVLRAATLGPQRQALRCVAAPPLSAGHGIAEPVDVNDLAEIIRHMVLLIGTDALRITSMPAEGWASGI